GKNKEAGNTCGNVFGFFLIWFRLEQPRNITERVRVRYLQSINTQILSVYSVSREAAVFRVFFFRGIPCIPCFPWLLQAKPPQKRPAHIATADSSTQILFVFSVVTPSKTTRKKAPENIFHTKYHGKSNLAKPTPIEPKKGSTRSRLHRILSGWGATHPVLNIYNKIVNA
ncbi:MAG: hypothetical protein O0V67_05010, partial [Methanocorpusculum sp.]|nr:hypothetical protein [Methanocorpusculum sp.]